jgi:hypothetical protein
MDDDTQNSGCLSIVVIFMAIIIMSVLIFGVLSKIMLE